MLTWLPLSTAVAFQDCKRYSVEDVNRMSTRELAETMMLPTIVSGALSAWKVPSNRESFLDAFGTHEILAARTHFAAHRDTSQFGTYAERVQGQRAYTQKHVLVSEFVTHFASEHIVLFSDEPGMSQRETALLNAMHAVRETPMFLSRRNDTTFFSFGSNRQGVNTANHGMTWIALIAGRKLWHVRDGSLPKPREPVCSIDPPERIPGTLACTQNAGEIIVLPTAWWHATCNLGEFTVGIGGQDSCDLGCTEAVRKDPNAPFCHDTSRHVVCWKRPTVRDEL